MRPWARRFCLPVIRTASHPEHAHHPLMKSLAQINPSLTAANNVQSISIGFRKGELFAMARWTAPARVVRWNPWTPLAPAARKIPRVRVPGAALFAAWPRSPASVEPPKSPGRPPAWGTVSWNLALPTQRRSWAHWFAHLAPGNAVPVDDAGRSHSPFSTQINTGRQAQGRISNPSYGSWRMTLFRNCALTSPAACKRRP
jgi:hypothetical protein